MVRVVFAVLLVSTFAFAQPGPSATDAETEKQFRAEVAAASAEAAAAYDEGNTARDAKRADDAIKAYRRVIELAPNSDHAHRRLCWVLVATLELDEAVAECELALKLAPSSPYDKNALALTLMARRRSEDKTRALDLAREAAQALPNDIAIQTGWCAVAAEGGNPLAFSKCSEHLVELDPNGLNANYFAAISAAGARDFDEAHRLLLKAKAAGLDDVRFDAFKTELERQEKADALPALFDVDAVLEPGLLILCVWTLVMVVLFLVGSQLSNATLRTVETASTLEGAGTSRERRLRRFYKLVLLLCGLYFYLSMPLMIVSVIAAASFATYVFDEMGAIPIYLLWALGVMIFMTCVAVVRSLFVQSEPDPPGKQLDLAQYPKLRALLDDVAAAIGTRAVDTVYLVPGTEIGVSERTGLLRTLLRRPSERRLILGVAVFDGMTQLHLRAILAHEYGHFRNQDTAGGGFALAVRRSLHSLVTRLAKPGVAGFFNPVWWFVLAFHRMYLGISQGASRLQEVLADRWAVRAYGSAAFEAGYRHVVSRTVEFRDDFSAKIKEVIDNNWSLTNLYDYDPEQKTAPADLAVAIEKEWTREPDAFDSHPASKQRIAWATRTAVPREPVPGDDAAVWELFPDPESLERTMTAVVREQILLLDGVVISDKDDDESDDVADAPLS